MDVELSRSAHAGCFLAVMLLMLVFPFQPQFTRPAFGNPDKIVALRFDDGYQDFYDNVKPYLDTKGFKATLAITTGFVGTEGYMDWTTIQELDSSGYEIASHGTNHLDLNYCSQAQLDSEIITSRSTIASNGITSPQTFVYPYGMGSSNGTVTSEVANAGYGRASNAYVPWPTGRAYTPTVSNHYAISVYDMNESYAGDFQAWANLARNNIYPIFMYHHINDHVNNIYFTNVTTFHNQMDWLASNGFTVVTLEQINLSVGTVGLWDVGSILYPTRKEVYAHGSAEIVTAQSKFGGASGSFNGATDYLTLADDADWYFDASDFTIDFQIRFNALPTAGNDWEIYSQATSISNHIILDLTNNGGTPDVYEWAFEVESGGSLIINDVENSPGLVVNTWYHIASVRSGNSWYIFQNGAQCGTTYTNTNTVPDLATVLFIGAYSSSYGWVNGWLDEFRVSKGIARWTANFTSPTARYDSDSYTVLLLHMDLATGESSGSTVFLDDVTTGQALFSKFSLSETANSILTINVYSYASGNMRASIFTDSSGPATKLCETADTAVSAAAWTSPSISGCGSLSAADYWLGLQWNPGTAYAAGPSYTAGSSNTGYRLYMAYGAFPASGSGGSLTSENYGVYATYSTSLTITFALNGVSNDASGTIVAIDGTNYVYGDFPKAFLWVPGSTHSVTATDPIVVTANQKQYVFSSWTNGNGLSSASGTYTTPDSAITVTAYYNTQYYLTVASQYGSPSPASNWYDAGSSISASVNSPVSGGTGTQYACTGWTGGGSVPATGSSCSTSFMISAASSIIWNWKTQYYFTIQVNPSDVGTTSPASNWYDSGQAVNIQAVPAPGCAFSSWSGSGSGSYTGTNNPAGVTMNSPITETANFAGTTVMSVGYSVVGGGTPAAPVFHYVLNGVTKSLTLSKTSKSVSVDAGTTWSVTPNPLGWSTSSQRWYSIQPLTGTASLTTLVFAFYRQMLLTLSYTVSGGGAGYSPPTVQANQFGSLASVALTNTATGYWFDYGSTATVGPNPLTGSTSSERWLTTGTTSGKVTISITHTFTFQHQFYLTMVANPSSAGVVSPFSGWRNAGVTVTINATPYLGHKFSSWTGTGTSSYTGTTKRVTITINSPTTETANFT